MKRIDGEKTRTISITLKRNLIKRIEDTARLAGVARSKIIAVAFDPPVVLGIIRRERKAARKLLDYLDRLERVVSGADTLDSVKDLIRNARHKKKGAKT